MASGEPWGPDHEMVYDMWQSGLDDKAIARAVSRSSHAVKKYRQLNRWVRWCRAAKVSQELPEPINDDDHVQAILVHGGFIKARMRELAAVEARRRGIAA